MKSESLFVKKVGSSINFVSWNEFQQGPSVSGLGPDSPITDRINERVDFLLARSLIVCCLLFCWCPLLYIYKYMFQYIIKASTKLTWVASDCIEERLEHGQCPPTPPTPPRAAQKEKKKRRRRRCLGCEPALTSARRPASSEAGAATSHTRMAPAGRRSIARPAQLLPPKRIFFCSGFAQEKSEPHRRGPLLKRSINTVLKTESKWRVDIRWDGIPCSISARRLPRRIEWFYWVLLGFTGFYRVLSSFTMVC